MSFMSKLFSREPPEPPEPTVDELVAELRKKSDIEIMARMRFRDRWLRDWCSRNQYAKVPASFLHQFAALDRVGAERIVKLMNEIKRLKEIPEIDHQKLEQHLADSWEATRK